MLGNSLLNTIFNSQKNALIINNSLSIKLSKFLIPLHGQKRTTFILRRKYPLKLSPYGTSFEKHHLKMYDYVYEIVENGFAKKLEPLKILLIKPVPGVGSPGQIVEMRRNIGRFDVILRGLGVYASPENLEKYSYLAEKSDESYPSSPYALKTVLLLEDETFNVFVSMENPWTIEPWHVRAAFRRSGINTPDYAITLPEKPITGPDLNLEQKEFMVKVKINDREEAQVRMRVHHIATNSYDQIPLQEDHSIILREPIFPEQAEILAKLNAKDSKMIEPQD